MRKVFKVLKTIIDIALTVFVLAFVMVVCLQRFSNNEISLFKHRMFTVVSGSMVPKYQIGDVLIAKETEAKDIKKGDDVSYLGNSGTFDGKVVTHQVVKIEKDVDGKYMFHTKGLANLVEDPIVYEDQLYGVVVHKAVLLSFVYKCVATKTGMFLFIGIPIIYVIASEMIAFMVEKEDERRRKLKENKNKEVEVKKDETLDETKEKIKRVEEKIKETNSKKKSKK